MPQAVLLRIGLKKLTRATIESTIPKYWNGAFKI